MEYILTSPKLKLTGSQLEKIKSASKNMEIKQAENAADLNSLLKGAGILLTFPMDFPDGFTAADAPKLKWIHTMSAGADKFMIPNLVNSKIILTNSSGIHAIPIAEHVIGMIIALERKFPLLRDCQNKKQWHRLEFSETSELCGKTAMIVGLGEIGLRIARILKAFELKTIGIKRDKADKPEFVDELYTTNEMGSALQDADYVIICLPYTGETNRMFDKNTIEKMKYGSVLINIGRGGIVDENALAESLRNGKLKGAGLDVFEHEPLPESSPFYSMTNVIVTPHVSGATPHYVDRAIEIFCDNLRLHFSYKKMINVVDKTKGY